MVLNNKTLFNTLSEYSSYQEKKAGQEIFTYGQEANKIYIVVKGLVGLFIKNETGAEVEIDRLASGDFLGVESLLGEDVVYSSRTLAYQDTVLMSFSPLNIRQLTQRADDLNQMLLTNLCQRVKTLQGPTKKFPEIDIASKKSAKEEATADFYLPGHGNYDELAKDSFKKYLYTKEIECPVCSANFEVKKIRGSRLRKKMTRDDLRPIYKGFNPIWYKIWICPECFYTARKEDYFRWRSSQKEKIKNKFKAEVEAIFSQNYQPGYSQTRRIDEVFTAYYLCLKSYELIKAEPDKIASLWLRLNWLYEDVGQEELSNRASLKAMDYLEDYYFNSYPNRSQDEEDKIALLLGVMFYKHDRADEALQLLGKLVHKNETKPVYKKLARDRYMEIRAEKRKQ